MSDETKKPSPVVLFSAGYDSLRLVHEAIVAAEWPVVLTFNYVQRYGKSSGDSPNDPWTVESTSSPVPQQPEQLFHMKRFVEAMRIYRYVHHDIVDITMGPHECVHKYDGIVQHPMWLLPALLLCRDGGEIRTGWGPIDCVWAYIERIDRIVADVSSVIGKSVKLTHPLRNTDKADTLKYLARHNLLQYVWTCESPVRSEDKDPAKSTPCGKCSKCEELAVTEFIRKRRDDLASAAKDEKPDAPPAPSPAAS